MKNSVLKKILSCLFVITILLSSTTVYADDKDLAKMRAGGGPLPTLKTVYSIDELSEYLSTYRIEYAKDKNFCTLEKDYPGTGEFYNKLDCIYFPKDIDINKINRIDLCNWDIYIYIKKSETENIQLTWEFDRESMFDYYSKKLGDKDSVKDDMCAYIMEGYFKNYNKPKTYNQYLTLSESGALDIKKVSINGIPVISHAYIRNYSYDKKDTSDNADLEVTYGYKFKNFGYEFDLGGNLPDRDLGYKYCDLVKVPLTIKKDLSAGEAFYEKSESLNGNMRLCVKNKAAYLFTFLS